MNSFYIHIGLHKTGTTALQSDIFPNIPNIKYIGRNYRASVYGEELYENIVRYSFLGDIKSLNKNAIKNKIEQALEQSNLLLSDEWFTSDYDFYSSGKGVRWQEKIYRLGKITNGLPVKIIVTTREPVDAMFSMYCEMLQAGQAEEYENFYHFAACNNSALSYHRGYLESLLLSVFEVTPNYIDVTELKNEMIQQKLTELFGVNVSCKIKKKYTKLRNNRGVEIIKSQGLYKIIRGFWLRIPLRMRKKIPDTAFQTIRQILFEKYSNKSLVSNPTEEELSAVRRLVQSEEKSFTG